MFYSEFYIYRENDSMLEFRRNKLQLCLCLTSGIILLILCFIAATGAVVDLFLIGLGAMFMVYGVKPLFSKSKIIIDKERKIIILLRELGKITLSSKRIQFIQINKIEIREASLGRSYAGGDSDSAGRDKIYLDVFKEGSVKLDDSYSDEYTNKLTCKLSAAIGCRVVCVRH